ncbi:hypothetical protein PsorP6_015018 [Peronosclerospora sorghi]|uniref:Uncharacterized protein n=1 Tax=Peronosclerospora sorghi TaxID=230839 RepID=A0ACC0VQU5_9STRA|nr:hypothetical protein PsorP6_015018 [Peronosclerospora sorghi]
MIDLSLREDDKDTSAKRSKSTIHDKEEETLVLERADKSPSFSDRKPDTKIEETHVGAADKTLVVAETLDRKTRSGAHKIKLTRKKNVKKTKVGAKELIDKLVSPHFSQRSISRRETPDSSKKRNKTVRSYAELAHESAPLQRKPAGTILLKWELVESRGNPPLGRWGHSFNKIAGDQVVVYDGTDDDEQTLGDLHVFDTTRIAGQLHQIVKRSPAHGMNLLLLPFGGERNSSTEGELDILSDTMLLDTESFSWYAPAIKGSPPSARTGHTCTALGNEVFVFGGSGGRNRKSSVHILDCGKLGIKDDHVR